MATVRFFVNASTFALQNLPSIYQLGSECFKQLFKIQIKKGGESISLEPGKN